VHEFLKASSAKAAPDDEEDFNGYAVESLDLSCNRSFGILDSAHSIPGINSKWKQRYHNDLIPRAPQLDHKIVSECVLEASMQLLLRLPALSSLDLSHCWTGSADAIRLGTAISKAGRLRIESCKLPPLDELKFLGISSTLSSDESTFLYHELENSGGFKTIRSD
jgi:hypothetical protein